MLGVPGSSLSYPTGAAKRVWAGAVTSSSFVVKADIDQTALAVRIRVSPNADMSAPVYLSDYQAPAITTGAAYTYRPVSFSVVGLSPATRYYYKLEFSQAASQGDVARSVTTAPSSASAFSFAFGSCCDLYSSSTVTGMCAAPVFRSIALDAPSFFMHLGDTIYSEVTTLDFKQRDLNARMFRRCPDVDALNQTTPIVYTPSDHDYAGNDCSLDATVFGGSATPSAAQVFANTRTVYDETVPHYPFVLSGLLTQVATFGAARFLLLDAYGASTYTGNTCLGSAQLAWLQQQLNQAATDGIQWLFIGQGRTWTAGSSGFHGFSDAFPAEQKTICDMIEACTVPVCLLVGDAHACAWDDGTNTAVSTDGNAFFPQLLSSGLYQTPSSATGPYSWNGVVNINTGTATIHQKYMVVAMSADNKSWTATLKTDPIDPSTYAPTVVGSVSSTDVTPAVSFANAAPSVAHGGTLSVALNKTWFGPCSVHWTASTGAGGTVNLLPNSKQTTFSVSAPGSPGSFTITLSSPSGCTISGTNPATVTVS